VVCAQAPCVAGGESVIKFPSPLNVLKDTYDYSCYCARLDEWPRAMRRSVYSGPVGYSSLGELSSGRTCVAPPPAARAVHRSASRLDSTISLRPASSRTSGTWPGASVRVATGGTVIQTPLSIFP
jgi:hypothetical protein